jgi:hypothetical protein
MAKPLFIRYRLPTAAQTPANLIPIALGGADKTITLPASVLLQGAGTDPDGLVTGYAWRQISGPNAASGLPATTASVTVTGLVAGVYLFGLITTDNKNAKSIEDVVGFTVAPAPVVVPPVVVLADIALSGSSSQNEGTSQTLSLSAIYSSGITTQPTTDVVWSDNAPNGVLSIPANAVVGDGHTVTVTAKFGGKTASFDVLVVDKTVVVPPPMEVPPTPGVDNDPAFALWNADARKVGKIPITKQDIYWPNNYHDKDFGALLDGSTATYFPGTILLQDDYSQAHSDTVIDTRRYRPKLSYVNAAYRNGYGPIDLYYVEKGSFDGVKFATVPIGAAMAKYALPVAKDVVQVYYHSVHPADQLSEFEAWGEYSDPRPFPASITVQPAKMMMAANGFEWEILKSDSPAELDPGKLDKLNYVNGFRWYLDYPHVEPIAGKNVFAPSSLTNGSWNYDVLTKWFADNGKDLVLCRKNTPDYIYNTWPAELFVGSEQKLVVWQGSMAATVAYGKTPQAYLASAKNFFQIAARYGSVSVSSSLLNVYTGTSGGNQARTGLGTVDYIELGNEKNSYWKGIQGCQTPAEMAAEYSAEYDGHLNTMGAGVGIKNADPSILVSAGGSAIRSVEEMRAMTDWCRQNRGYKADGSVNMPFDIWNYHAYANDGGSSQTGNITRGMAPEPAGLHLGFLEVKAFADEYWGGMPIILGEHGYDKSRYSTQRAMRPMDIKRDASGNVVTDGSGNIEPTAGDDNSVRQFVDAQWTSRTQEILGALGIFRMQYYMLNNASDPASPYSRYSDCGMFEPTGTPRVVARFNRQRLELQGNYVPTAHSFTPGANVWSVDKQEPATGKQLTCFWVPKEEAVTADFTFTVTAASTLVTLSTTTDVPVKTVYQPGTYTVQATESPAYLLRNQVV